MSSVTKRAVVFAGALVLLACGTARAGVSNVLEVKVPFAFEVQGQTFPAGQYLLQREDLTSSVLLLRGEKGNHSVKFFATTPAAGRDPAGDTPVLTFRRVEKQYQLSSVWQSKNQGEIVVGG